MQKYGFDSGAVDEFIAELDALAEELWNKYGPDGEGKDALLARLRELWSFFGGMDQEGSVAQWLSSLFTSGSEPVTNSAPVTAVSNAFSRSSRLSAAAGVRSNDADASVTVISKDQICLSFVIGVNQQRQGVPGVVVRFKDASIADAQLSEPIESNAMGLVILPTNLFVADEYDEVHLYVEVDPRKQGYRNYIIEDLEISLGQTFMDTLVPMEDEGADAGEDTAEGEGAEGEGVVSNAPSEPYMISASFNGKDIMHSEYEMIYSPANNALFTIKAVFYEPAGKQLPGLVMSWYEKKPEEILDGAYLKADHLRGLPGIHLHGKVEAELLAQCLRGTAPHLLLRQGRQAEIPHQVGRPAQRHVRAPERGHRRGGRRVRQRAWGGPGHVLQDSEPGPLRKSQPSL